MNAPQIEITQEVRQKTRVGYSLLLGLFLASSLTIGVGYAAIRFLPGDEGGGGGGVVAQPMHSIFTESFEGENFGAWVPDNYIAGHEYEDLFRAFLSRAQHYNDGGVQSVGLTIDGKFDDGTLWLERTIQVAPNRSYNVNINFWLYSLESSAVNRWDWVTYAGTSNPEQESDFNDNGPQSVRQQISSQAGWSNYNVADYNLDEHDRPQPITVTAGADGKIYIAVGISVVWETKRTHYLDLITVEITERG